MFAHAMKTLFAGAVLMAGAAHADEIVVGGKNFTEQQLLTAMTAQLLEAKGFEVDSRGGMGSAAVRQAMESGQIDVYWEYTGTSLITYNKVEEIRDLGLKRDRRYSGGTRLAPFAANRRAESAPRNSHAKSMAL